MHEIGLETADFFKSTNVINLLINETIRIIFLLSVKIKKTIKVIAEILAASNRNRNCYINTH